MTGQLRDGPADAAMIEAPAADPATVRPLEAVRGGAAPMGELLDRADLGAEPR